MIYDIYIYTYIYIYIFGSDSGVYFLQHTFHWWDSTLPLPLHFSAPRRWHIALALAILSAAQYLSIACQCQRVAVSGGHCHDRAMSIFR